MAYSKLKKYMKFWENSMRVSETPMNEREGIIIIA
jgi:hypothetical protein